MTVMMPQSVPEHTPAAEATMFRLIAEGPDLPGYYCLHSLGIARHRRKAYAEADLVIIGPAGIFCLEVKGGHVVRKQGTWTIGWPGGKTYDSKEGPFVQAEGVRWALLDFLEPRLGPGTRKEVLLGWGVAFPDITFERSDPEWDRDVVFDQRDKHESFGIYIERLERYFRRRLSETSRPQPPRLSPARVLEIVNCLRGDFQVVPSLGDLLVESQRELVRLSREQFAILDLALNEHNPRIMCQGAAGTGKTLIAIEATRRLAERGEKALLLCFNANLQRFLNKPLVEGMVGNARISTIHRFLGDLIRSAGMGSKLDSAKAQFTNSELIETIYPDLFEEAAAALIEEGQLPQFDVVVVDEAQDILSAPMMNCLDLILDRGLEFGKWLIFLDGGLQKDVYGRLDPRVLSHLGNLKSATFELAENFRNPRGIVSEMCTLTGAVLPICRRELVSSVDYVTFVDAKDQARKLRALLVDLIKKGIPAHEITVLSAKKREDACISIFPPDVGKEIVYLDSEGGPLAESTITAASISAFKGLENNVLILTDLPPPELMNSWTRSIFYVGMTRAKSKLFALIDQEFLDARTKLN